MNVSKIRLLVVVVLAGLVAACGGEPPVQTEAPARPVRLLEISGGLDSGDRTFPARIAANQRAELAFRVSGQVSELLVREGEDVAEGTVLARLDATDFQLEVNDREARFENAERDYARAQELVEGGFISKSDFDRIETTFRTARNDLDKARQDLAYTRLEAPFAGSIARRHIDQFEDVQAQQPIFTLQDLSSLEARIDVTEGLVRAIRPQDGMTNQQQAEGIGAWAMFEDLPDERFPLTFKEAATEADSQTQTFEVVFSMDTRPGVRIFAGMTATVVVQFGALTEAPTTHWLPATAVVADSGLAPRVWVFDEAAGSVTSRSVVVGRLQGAEIEVLEGLSDGDRVVTLGAAFLAEGMAVYPLKETEQAVPRADDPA